MHGHFHSKDLSPLSFSIKSILKTNLLHFKNIYLKKEDFERDF